MADLQTVAQAGPVRLAREVDVLDIDVDKLKLSTGDGLNSTEIRGNRNSYRQSDGLALLNLRVVRGDGVNTVLADSGTLATTQNILGMTVLVNGAGTVQRVATNGSIVDGFVGLTKHAIYYLGVAGQISLVPGVVEVRVGIAVSTTELLLDICCCSCEGELELQFCFSGALFDCTNGADFCLWGPGFPECLPALEFQAGIQKNWYCGFQTPENMDVSQASSLELRLAAKTAAPAVNTVWALNHRIVAPAQSLFAGGVLVAHPVQNVLPGGAEALVILNYPIPANTFVHGRQIRQTLARNIDTFGASMMLVGAKLLFVPR